MKMVLVEEKRSVGMVALSMSLALLACGGNGARPAQEDAMSELGLADTDSAGSVDLRVPDVPGVGTAEDRAVPDTISPADLGDAAVTDSAPEASPGDVTGDAPPEVVEELADSGALDSLAEVEDGLDLAEAVEDVEPEIAESVPPELYKPGPGCAEPLEYEFPGCAGVVCGDGKQCMGNGVCVPSGPFMLEHNPANGQVKPALFPNVDGSFAMAWYEVPQGSAWMDIYFQLFNPDGTSKSAAVKVDQDELSWARSPSVAGLPEGGYLVLWRSQQGFNNPVGFHGRVMSDDGLPQGTSFPLNTTPLENELGAGTNVDGPFARLLRDEHAAVAWAGEPAGASGDVNVYLRIFTSVGLAKTGELDVGGATTADEGSAAIADMPGQGLFTVWQSGDLWTKYVVAAAATNSSGTVTGFTAELSPGDDAYEGMPAAASFDEGVALVTWKAMQQTFTGPTDIRAALVDLTTMESLGQYDFGHDGSGTYPFYAPVEVGPWGRALTAWHSCASGLEGPFVRRFYLQEQILDCQADNIGGPPMANESVCRTMPAIAAFQDGRFLVAWNTEFTGDGTSPTRVMLRFLR